MHLSILRFLNFHVVVFIWIVFFFIKLNAKKTSKCLFIFYFSSYFIKCMSVDLNFFLKPLKSHKSSCFIHICLLIYLLTEVYVNILFDWLYNLLFYKKLWKCISLLAVHSIFKFMQRDFQRDFPSVKSFERKHLLNVYS